MSVLTRVLVSVLFIPVFLLIFFNGGLPLLILFSLFTLLATYEFRSMLAQKYTALPLVLIPLNTLFFVMFALMGERSLPLIFIVTLIAVGGLDVFFNRISGAVSRLGQAFLAVCYIALAFGFAYQIGLTTYGNYQLIWLIVTIWITDTFAYFGGMTCGKHRGIIKASPNKSLEGFLFGIVFAFVGSYAFHIIFKNYTDAANVPLIAIAGGVFGQFGDLVESLIKRDVGVKDSSKIIPGHGGILDRFDSFLFAAPAFYLLCQIAACLKR